MSEELSITRVDPMPVARQQPSVAEMLQGVLQGGVTADNVAVVKEVMALYRETQIWDAERAFAKSFVDLQGETLRVQATKGVPGRDGTIRFKFAPFEEIMREVGPKLKAHGFTVTFSTEFAEGRLVMSCTLQHVGGHSKTNKFAVRVGSGPPNASECQADGAANTYAKRFALCNCLNIQIDHDTDARAEGGTISPGQASDLRQRVRAVGADEKAFLLLASGEGKDFEDICQAKYDMLDALLSKKERLKNAKAV